MNYFLGESNSSDDLRSDELQMSEVAKQAKFEIAVGMVKIAYWAAIGLAAWVIIPGARPLVKRLTKGVIK